MRYYLPEWDDLVDPEYHFETDEYSEGHAKNFWKHDSYLWNLYSGRPPIDGTLVSRKKLEENREKLAAITSNGIYEFLRLPRSVSTMCDCGAWGYINEDKPTFRTHDMLEFYRKGQFSIGVSVDHLIVESIRVDNGKSGRKAPVENGNGTFVGDEAEPGATQQKWDTRLLSASEKKERWEITVENGIEMLDRWEESRKYSANFRIVGVIQGWDVRSYRQAASKLLRAGYDYLGIGGLARSPTGSSEAFGEAKTVYNVVRGVTYEIQKWCAATGRRRVDLHVFGFGRPRAIRDFGHYGVTSFDSATFMRSAWIGSQNYLEDHSAYTAIRVPDVRRSPKRSDLKGEVKDFEVMSLLRAYDRGQIGADSLSPHLANLVDAYGEPKPKQRLDQYKKTLEEKPWKQCPCEICKSLGIDVVVFRGNERNRRRGFHNNWVFYNRLLLKAFPRIAVVGMCSGKKLESTGLLPAFERYSASPLFKVYWNAVYDLPVDVKVLSAKYGVIDWSARIPMYDKKMQDRDVLKFADAAFENLTGYQITFFAGLSSYRMVAEELISRGLKVELYPKPSKSGRPLDILEYSGQMKAMREAICAHVQPYKREEIERAEQRILDHYS